MINKIFILFFTFLLIGSIQGWSKNYYISNSGSDSNDGLTEQTAWQTLDKLNNEMKGFKAGDSIFFHKGSTFYGTLKIHYLNGTSSAHISFKSYGTGKNPIITNGKLIENWIKSSGNIYEANVSETVYQVFKDDEFLQNSISSSSQVYRISKVNSQTAFISNDLIGHLDLKGSMSHVKPRVWTVNSVEVSSFDSSTGTIILKKNGAYNISAGNEFYLSNHKNLLKKEGEWSYDIASHKLYIYSTSIPRNIRATLQNNNGVEILNSHFVSVKDLMIKRINNNGVFIEESTNVILENNDFENCYERGIYVLKGFNNQVLNNKIEETNHMGIQALSDNVRIENNDIINTGIFNYSTYKGYSRAVAIGIGNNNAIVRKNKIVNTGYIGIEFVGQNALIENNFIQDVCLELTDGGAIYTYNRSFDDIRGVGSILKNNIIIGSTDFNKELTTGHGIYLDDRSHDVIVESNTIFNTETGIFLHNNKDNRIIKNNIYKPKNDGIWIVEDQNGGNGSVEGIELDGNNIFLEDARMNIFPLKISSIYNTFNFGSYNHNRYFNPFNQRNIGVKNETIFWNTFNNHESFNLEKWQKLTSNDINSEENEFYWESFTVENVIGTNLVNNGSFDKDVAGWGSPNTDLSIISEASISYMRVHPTSAGGAALSNTFSVKSNSKYLFEFDIKADSDVTLRLDVAKTGSPYTGILVRPIWADKSWKHYSILIDSDIDASDMRINYYSLQNLENIYLDNIEFKEVKTGPPLERSYFAFNKETITKAINIPAGIWEDLDGNVYSGTIVLEPFTSKIIILSDKSISSINANAGEDVEICKGESSTLNAMGGSSYQWSNGATTQSISVSPDQTTMYTVTVSEGSESATDEVVVTVNEVLANAGADRTITEGESISLTATGGDSYLWSTGETSETIIVSPSATVTYFVKVVKGSCEDTDEVNVTVNPATGGGTAVIANAGVDQEICLGESVTLTASGGSSYKWNTGATTKSITVSPTSTSTYTVTVKEGSKSDSDDVIVTVNEVKANAGSDRAITEGETITLVATGGDSYLWNTGERTASISVSPNSTRIYSVTTYKGYCFDMDEVKVTVQSVIDLDPPLTRADAGEDMSICSGETIMLNGSGGATYLWSTGETSSSISVSPSRTATYELTVTRGGITNSDSVTITVENCENEIIGDQEDLAILEMAVYPNPTQGELTIRINNIDEDANFTINDTKGSLIYSEYIDGQNPQFDKQIDLSRFSDGLYFVRLYSGEQYLIKKLMVQ